MIKRMSLVLRSVVLALLACVACQPPSDEPTGEGESASNDEQSVTVVLNADGTFTLEGKTVPADEFAAEYGEVVMRLYGETRGHAGTLRLVVDDPAQTTWEQLIPGLSAYGAHYGEAIFVQGLKVPMMFDHHHPADAYQQFEPIRVSREMSVEAIRAQTQLGAGWLTMVECQPTCTLDVFMRLLQVLSETEPACGFSHEGPDDGSLIRLSPYSEEVFEDPEEPQDE